MATLLPTLSSDEDDNKIINDEGNTVSSSDEENDNNYDDQEMNDDFEFGGLLGEDGESNSTLSILPSSSHNDAWSYKSALKILQQNDFLNGKVKPLRTNVADIIAAARSNLKKSTTFSSSNDKRSNEETMVDSFDEMEETDQKSNGKESSSDNTGKDCDEIDEETDDSEDDEIDDVQKAQNMQDDVIKLRQNKASLLSNNNEKNRTGEGENNDNDEEVDEDSVNSSTKNSESDPTEDEDAKIEAAKADIFFDNTTGAQESENEIEVFVQLNLSRPLLRGVASIGFVKPTPIQARVIPVALSGRDVCASAVTGSGKTAAFLLPIMERILQRGGGRVYMSSSKRTKVHAMAATKGLVLTPTRELAAQCLGMMIAMAKFTNLRAVLVVGGTKNVAAQATELRTRPDVVIATPGRCLDHLTNSSGVDFDDLEFLILDEADRLLDLGFQDEVHEIVKSCSGERQTLLFSATMNTKVDELIKLSLKQPVRIHVTDKDGRNTTSGAEGTKGVEVAERLEQEFVRVRSGNEGVNREAMLLSLLTRTFLSRTIVFFSTKADAHRLMIVCGLCGIKCTELHGNLTQTQRLEALELFREGSVDVLFATDLAARGLDISNVKAVVNFEMPSQVETYVHRIGRTARAGRGGKSCTLIGEGRRHLMKEVIKDAEQKRQMLKKKVNRNSTLTSSTGIIRSRTIPPGVVAHFVAKIISLEPHIKEVIAAEAVARMDRITEMEAMKVRNIIEHGDEIKSRPQKEWFASAKQKTSIKEATSLKHQQVVERGQGNHRMTRNKRRLREAKQDLIEAQEEALQEAEENGKKMEKILTDKGIKSLSRTQKKQAEVKVYAKDRASINEEDMLEERARKKRKKQKSSEKRKGAFASDSVGDANLFNDEKITYAKKGRDNEFKSAFVFKGYDPNKQRKQKKKSVNSFKSKSKYKRK